jgi:phosphatidate cytidylyltransferase
VRTRIASSVGVVIVGLIPALIGGPVFALLLVLLGAAGYREYLDLGARVVPGVLGRFSRAGYWIIVALAIAALWRATTTVLFALVALSVALPLVLLLLESPGPGAFSGWGIASSGSLYLGLPVYAGIALRDSPGAIEAHWLSRIATWLSLGWESAPRGLAWVLTVILVTWIGDSVAYLVGRSIGRRQLAPQLSPNKTVEGAVAGLAGSVVVGAACFVGLGPGAWWLGAAVGFAIAVAGQIGDLAESFLKRQAGVKDSGAAIPGHGGILDRIDALLFAFPTAFLMVAGMGRLLP